MKRIVALMLGILALLAVCGCGESASSAMPKGGAENVSYRHVSPEEAQRLMQAERGYLILDVRTQQEYAEGHIPNAICVPNETIDKTPPKELADKDQMILVYCRSGRRSADAAQKLANMGYTNVVDFGGIKDWKVEVVK